MYKCFAHMHMWTSTWIPGACKNSQKKALDSMELELWMTVSHHVDARN